MASILNVDQINNAAGTSAVTLDPSTGKPSFPNGMTLPAGVGGKMLQVVQATPGTNGYTQAQSYVNVTSTSFVDISTGGHYVDITPISASSKILVMASFPTYNNTSYTYHKMVRYTGNTTYDFPNIGNGAYDIMSLNGSSWHHVGFNWIDTPSTTSLIRYKMFVKVAGGSSQIGFTSSGGTNDNVSSYIVVEIAQ